MTVAVRGQFRREQVVAWWSSRSGVRARGIAAAMMPLVTGVVAVVLLAGTVQGGFHNLAAVISGDPERIAAVRGTFDVGWDAIVGVVVSAVFWGSVVAVVLGLVRVYRDQPVVVPRRRDLAAAGLLWWFAWSAVLAPGMTDSHGGGWVAPTLGWAGLASAAFLLGLVRALRAFERVRVVLAADRVTP